MRSRIGLLLSVPLLLVAACGGSDDAATTDASPADPATDAEVDSDVEVDTVVEQRDDDDDVAAPSAGGGTAVLTLENGETIEFDGLKCTLEPQIATGSEILFTATSFGDPAIDITQFGDDGVLAGVATVEVYDASYETLWDAFSIGGSVVELTLEGTTIRGTADFYEEVDEGLPAPVRGEVVANC